jgi:hypothetical protein
VPAFEPTAFEATAYDSAILLTPPGTVHIPPPIFVTPFDKMVERADRAALAILGGEPIVYTPQGGAGVPITGIYDSAFVLAKGTSEAGVETQGPAVFVRFSDLPVDPELDDPILLIRGASYRVIERIPDDIGGIVLALRVVT